MNHTHKYIKKTKVELLPEVRGSSACKLKVEPRRQSIFNYQIAPGAAGESGGTGQGASWERKGEEEAEEEEACR